MQGSLTRGTIKGKRAYVALKEYFVRIMSLTSHNGLFSVRYSRLIVALWLLQSSFVAHQDSELLSPDGNCLPVQPWMPGHDADSFTLAFPRIFG